MDGSRVTGREVRLRHVFSDEAGLEVPVDDVSGSRRTSATLSAFVLAPGVVPDAITPGVTPAAFSLLFPQIEP
jgi:hypothetical protein